MEIDEFKKKSFFEIKKLTLEELNEYYRAYRQYKHSKSSKIAGIELRKKIHSIITLFMKFERLYLRHSLKIIGDERINTGKPRVYAVTHVGRYDIETVIESLKDDAWFVWGDPGELYRSLEIILLNAIGMIFVDTDDKEDRKLASEVMVELLQQNGNVLIYPEGAWNITENEIVMKLFVGTVKAAIQGKADIIPVAVEYYGNDYFVNIGKNIDTSNMKIGDVREESDKLRDVMATLKWDIWEYVVARNGLFKRSSLPNNCREIFLEEIMKDSDNGYTVDVINNTRFIDKEIVTADEAFEHLAQIDISKKTNFIFKNMNFIERERQANVLKKNIKNAIL